MSTWQVDKFCFGGGLGVKKEPGELNSRGSNCLSNEAQTNKEIEFLRYSVNKGKPYGSDNWTNKMIDKFNLKATLRNPGRPNKGS